MALITVSIIHPWYKCVLLPQLNDYSQPFMTLILSRMSQKLRRLVCCAGRRTDHSSRSNPCPETHGLGAVERRNLRKRTGVTICSEWFWCPNTAGKQLSSHLRTLIEMCGITNLPLHIQINGLVERGPVPWSPDLWGSVKSVVYSTQRRSLLHESTELYWWHVECTLPCSTAPKPCGSGHGFHFEK